VGTHSIGIAVMNEGDSDYDAGLLVDDVSISDGSFADGFQSGLGAWETLGDVTVAEGVGGAIPPEGNHHALLVSTSVSPPVEASDIEAFLGLSSGTLSNVANQEVATDHIQAADGIGDQDTNGGDNQILAFTDVFNDSGEILEPDIGAASVRDTPVDTTPTSLYMPETSQLYVEPEIAMQVGA
jgi:hypothetical protein